MGECVYMVSVRTWGEGVYMRRVRVKALLHCAILSATCLAMALRDKLLENCIVQHGLSRNFFVAWSVARSRAQLYFSQWIASIDNTHAHISCLLFRGALRDKLLRKLHSVTGPQRQTSATCNAKFSTIARLVAEKIAQCNRALTGVSVCTWGESVYMGWVCVHWVTLCTLSECVYTGWVCVQGISVCTWGECVYMTERVYMGWVCVHGVSVCTWGECVHMRWVCVRGASVCTWGESVYMGRVFVHGVSMCTWGECLYMGWVCVHGVSVFVHGVSVCTWGECVYIGWVCVHGVSVCTWGECVYMG